MIIINTEDYQKKTKIIDEPINQHNVGRFSDKLILLLHYTNKTKILISKEIHNEEEKISLMEVEFRGKIIKSGLMMSDKNLNLIKQTDKKYLKIKESLLDNKLNITYLESLVWTIKGKMDCVRNFIELGKLGIIV